MLKNTTPGFWLYAGLFFALVACDSKGVKIEKTDQGSRIVNDTATISVGEQGVIDAEADSTVRVAFPANDSVVTVMGKLARARSKFTATIPVQNKHRLTATLIPLDSASNIRFNQVIYPNEKAGGPFGKTISVPTRQDGEYQLIIDHNLMTAAKLADKFRLHITLSR